ncbi:MAG: type II secretion system F family protein [Immundisolibacteraceae bacterium]|nr:type II secretion system F family protein [Immundisolibacteraceae bacterium]
MAKKVTERYLPQLYLTLRQGEQAGVPLIRTLSLCEQIAPSVSRVVVKVSAAVSRGAGVAEAGFNFGLWSGIDYHCLKAAQYSGSLEQMFGRLEQHHMLRQRGLQRLRTDLIPVVLLLLVSLAVMPLPLLVSGEWSVSDYGWFLFSRVAGLGIGIVGLRKLPGLLRRAQPTSMVVDQLLVSLPIIGPFYCRRQLRDFFYALALMLEAGVDAQQAVKFGNVSANSQTRRRIEFMSVALEKGATVAEAMALIEGVNATALAMVNSGEAAGRIDQMLMHYCQTETELTQQQNRRLLTWAPRLVYFGLAGLIGWQLISAAI